MPKGRFAEFGKLIATALAALERGNGHHLNVRDQSLCSAVAWQMALSGAGLIRHSATCHTARLGEIGKAIATALVTIEHGNRHHMRVRDRSSCSAVALLKAIGCQGLI